MVVGGLASAEAANHGAITVSSQRCTWSGSLVVTNSHALVVLDGAGLGKLELSAECVAVRGDAAGQPTTCIDPRILVDKPRGVG